MGEFRREELICSGCGVKIQTNNKEGLGYTPPSALKRDVIICQRCFRLKHYNDVQDVPLTDDDFLKILTELGQKEALIVKIVDIFDFDGSWLPGLHRFSGKNPVLLIGNKADLLPKSVKHSKVIQWMKKAAKEYGLKPANVHLMSAKTGEAIMEVANLIDQERQGKDVYIVGCTNTGKSTFINRVLKEFGAEDEMLITTSNIPGTTLDMIDIPLDDGSFLYDTPGIINHHQVAHLLDKNELKMVSPSKEIKPKVFQLNPGQTLFFGGMGRIDFVSGEPQSFIVYISNELMIHRTKTEKADSLYENHLGELLSPPFEKNKEEFPPLVGKDWKVPNGKMDLVFSGLGWVTISGSGSSVRTHAPKGVAVSMRPAIF
ncbi:ribosome biogenesis GTPase YqeH [Salipaludibacillus agaradhaerens]|uniref:Ribosome biogenesis GTPase YqeH n=1 Tax=Salipaludibacillus agaradhaerens TaxID=76935 RepID=A0A9Q4B1U6_SALAG|nr:ribosome biogenesis GTPase YqeH [Salipaludibacillus agaradhaerens]MCR6096818.1 ribosome biogenesis GTPase YqeH [Salipaludibacillus agaradhaerens]MCR6113623.1 ribosome biogenesis GTPase YqeH [Salipaludibacillus agaradhaerens]